MKSQIKLALRRWAIRQLIKLVDRAEEWLYAVQVQLRYDLSDQGKHGQHPSPTVLSSEDMLHQRTDDQHARHARPESEKPFMQWEARRSGVAPVAKKHHRVLHRRRAADFDAQIAAKRREYLQ